MQKLFAFLLALLVFFQMGDAQAIQYKKNTVYKVDDVVYVDGTPSSKSTVDFGKYDSQVSKTVGSCGQVSITAKQVESSPSVKIGTKTFDLSKVTAIAPKCTKGEFTPPTTKPYVSDSGTVYIPGYKAGDKVMVTLTRNYLKKISFNKCGTARFGSTKTRAIPANFTYNAKTYTLSTLPTAPGAAKCSSKGVSAPPKDGKPADWGLPASAANLVDADWVEDIALNDFDDTEED